MTISVLSKNQIISKLAVALRVSGDVISDEITIELLAQALRRAAGILCPCARHDLERAVAVSFSKLAVDDVKLASDIEVVLESLITFGEIMEMRAELNDPWNPGRFILRPGPPAFVTRNDGAIIILGVAGDEITPLTDEMNAKLELRGVLRIIPALEADNVKEILLETGLIELSEKSWLHLPRVQTAESFISDWQSLLRPMSGMIDGLKVIDSAESHSFYAKRWSQPNTCFNGLYVGRRPQKYGAGIWCLVELNAGSPIKMIDLISKGDRERPCDIAWRLQMALDARVGAPQTVRVSDNQAHFVFFSPLPSWAERKIAVFGDKEMQQGCLFAYKISPSHKDSTLQFLREYLWLETVG